MKVNISTIALDLREGERVDISAQKSAYDDLFSIRFRSSTHEVQELIISGSKADAERIFVALADALEIQKP